MSVIGRDPTRACAIAAAMREHPGVPVAVATPVVLGVDLRPGPHVDAAGAFRPEDRAVDTETVRRTRATGIGTEVRP